MRGRNCRNQMNRRKILVCGSWIVLAFFLVVGCDPQSASVGNRANNLSGSTSSAKITEITISAASSLKDALNTIESLYVEENPEVKITYNFGSSGSLQQQIEQGAPVDIFLSAAKKQIDALQNKGLILKETRQDLLTNKLVLIVSSENTQVKSFQDLNANSTKKIALGEPESVPAGKYALETLNSLKISTAVKPKLIYAKDVRQVLNYVVTGNADAGFVYYSDAKISDRVKIIETASQKYHSPIVYPVAVLKDSKLPEQAKKFVKFLSTPQAEAIFKQYGFTMAQ
jgi:molybdate transport system substrate-binding protein